MQSEDQEKDHATKEDSDKLQWVLNHAITNKKHYVHAKLNSNTSNQQKHVL